MISNNLFITSASCFFPRHRHQDKILQIRTGYDQNMYWNVSTIIHHHKYDEDPTKFNIAIAIAKEKIELGALAICYANKPQSGRSSDIETMLFGSRKSVTLESTNTCETPFICAKRIEPKDFGGECVADEGSPIVKRFTEAPYYQMIGIIADKENYCDSGTGTFISLRDSNIVDFFKEVMSLTESKINSFWIKDTLANKDNLLQNAAKKLVRYMTDPNPSDKNGRTLLHAAAEKGLTETVEELLDVLKEVNGDVNPADGSGHRPMSYAASFGHFLVVEKIGDAVLLDSYRNPAVEFQEALDMDITNVNVNIQTYLNNKRAELDSSRTVDPIDVTDATTETDEAIVEEGKKKCELCNKIGTYMDRCVLMNAKCNCKPNYKGDFCEECNTNVIGPTCDKCATGCYGDPVSGDCQSNFNF